MAPLQYLVKWACYCLRTCGLLCKAILDLWLFWQGQNGFPITPLGNDGVGAFWNDGVAVDGFRE